MPYQPDHQRPLPTLELGDPSKPAILFLHDFSDNGAAWANLFGAFCGDNGAYFCIATTASNVHPDLPVVTDLSHLGFGEETEKIVDVAKQLKLSNITLVGGGWGSFMGYIAAYKVNSRSTRLFF